MTNIPEGAPGWANTLPSQTEEERLAEREAQDAAILANRIKFGSNIGEQAPLTMGGQGGGISASKAQSDNAQYNASQNASSIFYGSITPIGTPSAVNPGQVWSGTGWTKAENVPSSQNQYALNQVANLGVVPGEYIPISSNPTASSMPNTATIYNPATTNYEANPYYTGNAYTSLGINNQTQGIPTGYPGNVGFQSAGAASQIYNQVTKSGGIVAPSIVSLAYGQGNKNVAALYDTPTMGSVSAIGTYRDSYGTLRYASGVSVIDPTNIVAPKNAAYAPRGSAYEMAVRAETTKTKLDPNIMLKAKAQGYQFTQASALAMLPMDKEGNLLSGRAVSPYTRSTVTGGKMVTDESGRTKFEADSNRMMLLPDTQIYYGAPDSTQVKIPKSQTWLDTVSGDVVTTVKSPGGVYDIQIAGGGRDSAQSGTISTKPSATVIRNWGWEHDPKGGINLEESVYGWEKVLATPHEEKSHVGAPLYGGIGGQKLIPGLVLTTKQETGVTDTEVALREAYAKANTAEWPVLFTGTLPTTGVTLGGVAQFSMLYPKGSGSLANLMSTDGTPNVELVDHGYTTGNVLTDRHVGYERIEPTTLMVRPDPIERTTNPFWGTTEDVIKIGGIKEVTNPAFIEGVSDPKNVARTILVREADTTIKGGEKYFPSILNDSKYGLAYGSTVSQQTKDQKAESWRKDLLYNKNVKERTADATRGLESYTETWSDIQGWKEVPNLDPYAGKVKPNVSGKSGGGDLPPRERLTAQPNFLVFDDGTTVKGGTYYNPFNTPGMVQKTTPYQSETTIKANDLWNAGKNIGDGAFEKGVPIQDGVGSFVGGVAAAIQKPVDWNAGANSGGSAFVKTSSLLSTPTPESPLPEGYGGFGVMAANRGVNDIADYSTPTSIESGMNYGLIQKPFMSSVGASAQASVMISPPTTTQNPFTSIDINTGETKGKVTTETRPSENWWSVVPLVGGMIPEGYLPKTSQMGILSGAAAFIATRDVATTTTVGSDVVERSTAPKMGGADWTATFIGADNKPSQQFTEKKGEPYIKDGVEYQDYITHDLSKVVLSKSVTEYSSGRSPFSEIVDKPISDYFAKVTEGSKSGLESNTAYQEAIRNTKQQEPLINIGAFEPTQYSTGFLTPIATEFVTSFKKDPVTGFGGKLAEGYVIAEAFGFLGAMGTVAKTSAAPLLETTGVWGSAARVVTPVFDFTTKHAGTAFLSAYAGVTSYKATTETLQKGGGVKGYVTSAGKQVAPDSLVFVGMGVHPGGSVIYDSVFARPSKPPSAPPVKQVSSKPEYVRNEPTKGLGDYTAEIYDPVRQTYGRPEPEPVFEKDARSIADLIAMRSSPYKDIVPSQVDATKPTISIFKSDPVVKTEVSTPGVVKPVEATKQTGDVLQYPKDYWMKEMTPEQTRLRALSAKKMTRATQEGGERGYSAPKYEAAQKAAAENQAKFYERRSELFKTTTATDVKPTSPLQALNFKDNLVFTEAASPLKQTAPVKNTPYEPNIRTPEQVRLYDMGINKMKMQEPPSPSGKSYTTPKWDALQKSAADAQLTWSNKRTEIFRNEDMGGGGSGEREILRGSMEKTKVKLTEFEIRNAERESIRQANEKERLAYEKQKEAVKQKESVKQRVIIGVNLKQLVKQKEVTNQKESIKQKESAKQKEVVNERLFDLGKIRVMENVKQREVGRERETVKQKEDVRQKEVVKQREILRQKEVINPREIERVNPREIEKVVPKPKPTPIIPPLGFDFRPGSNQPSVGGNRGRGAHREVISIRSSLEEFFGRNPSQLTRRRRR